MESSRDMKWFDEVIDGYGIRIKIKKKLFESSGMQKIEVYETEFGKMLSIDGKIQLIEEYEASYHEMLVHVPMIMHPNPEKVLIIGGGDGGTAREVLKYNPEIVKMVELDKNVIDAGRKYIGIDKGAFEDSRLNLLYEDGVKFVKECNERFDVLVVDGTDPSPVSEALISSEFYRKCSEITEFFAIQSQSPLLQKEEFIRICRGTTVFNDRRVYLSFVPMYPGGLWSFILASSRKIQFDIENIKRRFEEKRIKTEYYTPEVHLASFSLPRWIKDMIIDER